VRPGPVEPRVLALLLMLAAGCAGAAELGTLFNTPEERARLDRLRRGEPPAGVSAAGSAGPREVTGFVQRSDGRGTVWIDGVPVPVASPRAAPLFDPKGVRGYSDRHDSELRIERKTAR
jgi:hypothetical protein